MDIFERVMRTMTHINIGGVIALVAWVLWSSGQGAAGPARLNQTTAETSVRVSPTRTVPAPPLTLILMRAGEALPPCCQMRSAAQEPGGSPHGADL